MKVFNIMMFLLIFNVAISVVGSLHIYNMGTVGVLPNEKSLADVRNPLEGIWIFLGQSAYALFIGTIAGALIGYYGAKIPTTEGMAYGFFAGLITSVFISSTNVLWRIVDMVPGYAQGGIAIVVGLFLGICGILFAFGFLQLVRGGISSYV